MKASPETLAMYKFILYSSYTLVICFFGRYPCIWLIVAWINRKIRHLRHERHALLLKRREFRNMARQIRKEEKCSDSSVSSA